MLLQPGDGLGVQVVGRFVQKQDVRLLQEQPAEGHPPPFAAGEHLTGVSPAGQRSASIAISSRESRSQASASSFS